MTADAPIPTGTLLGGDFEVVRPLAKGGMGTVYVAHQRSADRECAVKVMHHELITDARSRERFEREAELCVRIESEHVVKVFGSGIDEASETPWIAMELVDGTDLEALMKRKGALPPEAARSVLLQIFEAIAAAHRVGVVHRDLKPQNILVERPGDGAAAHVKVLDFGISKQSREQGTDTTAAVGSPLWMAPEQARRGRLTPATDVFALALLAFRLLAGVIFWGSAAKARVTLKELLLELLMKPFPAASERSAELNGAPLPDGFDAWFALAADRDPAKRFRDASEALAALRPVLAAPRSPPPPLPRPTSPRPEPIEDDASLARTVALRELRATKTPLPAERDPDEAPGATASPRPASTTGPRSVLRSPTPAPLPELIQAAQDERAERRPPSRAFIVTATAVLVLLVIALVLVAHKR